MRNPAWDMWRKAGMIYDRFRPVANHKKLMKMVEADDLDMDGVRVVLKELINAALPVEPVELEVMDLIDAERASQLVGNSDVITDSER